MRKEITMTNKTIAYQMQKDAKSNERRDKEQRKLERKEREAQWAKKQKQK